MSVLWSGKFFDSGTIVASGNSGWLKTPPDGNGMERCYLSLVPANLATDETLDLDLNVAFDSSGNGDVKIHDFTQVTATNVQENVILPGEDSVGILWKELGTNAGILSAPIPGYWKFTWTLGGTTKSMDFEIWMVVSD